MHHLVDGNSRPLVTLIGPGQAGDAPMFPHLMRHLQVRRAGRGRPRTRPDRVRGDKPYSSMAIRAHLRDRGIVAVIPEQADQVGHRKRRGSRGGRPPAFDPVDYRGRNVVERQFNLLNSGVAWPLVTTSWPSSTDQRSSCTPWSPEPMHCQTLPRANSR
ncbi:transposase [Amycolatopsis sp. Hca4]|uniref:transposase n=1 Tax=Amycolatopsis sp. Hca4 TaxID=2742131 RepID=UPI0020CB2275|nr:transposase [Amycolatopsis sp. Hca4]